MRKLIAVLTMVVTTVAFAPRPAAAQDCTDGYVRCLNDSYALEGVLRTLADLECFAEYTGCVAGKVAGS